ncbi:MAG TPA: ABC transporter permease [Clostridiales bacterium]|jgi:putative ABC transport system permease protein|nr:ABC transporter permease [Clostridiales bacterium]
MILGLNILELFAQLPGAVAQGLIWGIMAIGVYITFRILDIADLTVDGSFCTGGAVCVMLIVNGYDLFTALMVSFIVGMLTGLVTGLFHTFFGISAILAGILTQLGLWSVNLAIMGKPNQALNVNNYNLLVSLRYLQEVIKGTRPFYWSPILVVGVFVAFLIAILYWFFGTELGSSIRATGNNQNMSRALGINTKFNKVLGLMLSNGIVALSGALLSQYQGFADINMGRGAIVIGLAAVIIGEVLFARLFRNFSLRLLGVVIGAIIYYIVIQTVLWLKLNPNYLKLLSAVVVSVFLAIPHWKGKLFTARRKGGSDRA